MGGRRGVRGKVSKVEKKKKKQGGGGEKKKFPKKKKGKGAGKKKILKKKKEIRGEKGQTKKVNLGPQVGTYFGGWPFLL